VKRVIGYGVEMHNNLALIDNQNLYLSAVRAKSPWRIDMKRFRVYLEEKYHITEARLYMGAHMPEQQRMYDNFRSFGYELQFRQHSIQQAGTKKGNVDSDITFALTKFAMDDEGFDKVYLVSGDGDYKLAVDFLIQQSKFGKILLPSHENASSLYKQLELKYYAYLDDMSMRLKIGLKK